MEPRDNFGFIEYLDDKGKVIGKTDRVPLFRLPTGAACNLDHDPELYAKAASYRPAWGAAPTPPNVKIRMPAPSPAKSAVQEPEGVG